MRIFLTGNKGQLGRAITAALPAGTPLLGIDIDELDIADRAAVNATVADFQPDLIINAAAYTDVDGCARDPELAYRANALGPQNLALAAQAAGAALLHVSTNEVFAGTEPAGYQEWQPLNPINPYGRSKAAGEFHVRHLCPRHYIVRTAWLYAAGGRNFIHAILQRARETGRLRVVTDEVGNPTFADDLAAAIVQLVDTAQFGTYHFVNAGSCSRWEFANEILRQAGLTGVVNEPILGKIFSRASTPPKYGALNNNAGAAIGISLRPWPAALADYITRYERRVEDSI